MRARSRATLVLVATLVLGVLLGVALGGVLRRALEPHGPGWGSPPRFADEMERIIRPRSDEQRRAIRPILEAAGRDNERITREAREELRGVLLEMIGELEPHLDEDQLERLREFESRPPPGRGPGLRRKR